MLKRSRRDEKNTQKNSIKKDLNEPDYYDGVVSHLEPDILECEVKCVLRSTATNKASGCNEITAAATAAKSLQSCLTLCNPINGSPPGSPVPVILQAKTLEWVAVRFLLQCMKVKRESESEK